MKKKKGFIILFIIIAFLFAMLLELSKNTLWGWAVFAAVMAFFLTVRLKLKNNGRLIRFLSWIILFAALFLVFKLSYPPYKRVPAVNVKEYGAVAYITRRLPDIYIQSVLAHRLPVIVCRVKPFEVVVSDEHDEGIIEGRILFLHEFRSKIVAGADTLPFLRLLRLLPSKISDRRSGIGDTRIDLHIFVCILHPGKLPL